MDNIWRISGYGWYSSDKPTVCEREHGHVLLIFPWTHGVSMVMLCYVMLCFVLLVYQGVMVKLTVHSGQSWPIRSDSWWCRWRWPKSRQPRRWKSWAPLRRWASARRERGTMWAASGSHTVNIIYVYVIWFYDIYIYTYYICIYIMYIRCIDNGIDCISDTFYDFQSTYPMLCMCTCTYT